MKKAIVIGASSGIGRALALVLANHGYEVGVTARRAELLAELQAIHPAQIKILAFDVTHDIGIHLNALLAQLGGLDLLVYSSGVGELNADLDIELERPTIEVNVKAFNEAMVWAYRYFEQQKHGHIVAISSIAGLRGGALAPAYNASKAYQINYLEGLRQKATKQKLPITITDIRPGFVNTAMAKGEQLFWVASPEKAAEQIFDAIQAQKSVKYVSKRWGLIAVLFKLLPRFIYQRL